MKTVLIVCTFFLTFTSSIAQQQSISESDYQLGMFNTSSSKESFTYSKNFKMFSVQLSSLPLFAKQFKIYSSLGVSGQLIISNYNKGKFYTYTGIQRIQTELGERKNHINMGVGLGFKTEINQTVELICQGGCNTLNAIKN